MSNTATIEGREHIPAEPVLVIPNRVNTAALQALAEALGGHSKVVWLIEHTLRPKAEIINLLIKQKANGYIIPPAATGPEALHHALQSMYAAGRHVVLLPGRPLQAPAGLADAYPALVQRLLSGWQHLVLPVYVGMYNLQHRPFVTTEDTPEETQVSIRPVMAPGTAHVSAITAAWMDASAEQTGTLLPRLYAPADAQHPAAATLPHALLRSLTTHPNALILDGVDNTQMTYSQLLLRAASLARQLRIHVSNKRIGIILPPGKFSIIANVACVLAGITPVNIDYYYGSAAFESAAQQAELDRLITEHNFIEMQPDFPWPLTRDILFIDTLADNTNQRLSFMWRFFRRVVTPAHIAKWIRLPETIQPQDEALAVFSPSTGSGSVRGSSLSHSTILAGAALSNSRFRLKPGQRILSALPFYHQAGLLEGLIYPLLQGLDIITYSLPTAGKRLGELARKHQAAMAVFTPRQTADVLAKAAEGDFESVAFFHVAGKVSAEMAAKALEQHHVHLCECYLPQECSMPIACNMAPMVAEDGRPVLPCNEPGTAGLPLPGVAVRVTDLDDPLRVQPLGKLGLVWVKGPGMVPGAADKKPGTPERPAHEHWWCTGEVGYLREDGLLVVQGPRTRFSQIEGEIIFHGEVERLMAKYLNVPNDSGAPQVAVLGVQDEKTGLDMLVLFTTTPKVVGPNEKLSLYYALSNDHRSTNMTPGRIIPLRAIPTLPGGMVDYARCMSLYQYLQRQ